MIENAKNESGRSEVGGGRGEGGPAGSDLVNHPPHYNEHPSGVEAIVVCEHMNFCRGNAMKYLWRAGIKGGAAKEIEDLEKARWYLDREIARLKKATATHTAPPAVVKPAETLAEAWVAGTQSKLCASKTEAPRRITSSPPPFKVDPGMTASATVHPGVSFQVDDLQVLGRSGHPNSNPSSFVIVSIEVDGKEQLVGPVSAKALVGVKRIATLLEPCSEAGTIRVVVRNVSKRASTFAFSLTGTTPSQ